MTAERTASANAATMVVVNGPTQFVQSASIVRSAREYYIHAQKLDGFKRKSGSCNCFFDGTRNIWKISSPSIATVSRKFLTVTGNSCILMDVHCQEAIVRIR